MIRTTFPISPVKQVQLRWEHATRRSRQAVEQRRRALRADATPPQVPHDDYLMLRWREEVERKRAAFLAFEARYDDLVGLLCIAAQEGVTPRRVERYREHRSWLTRHYASVQRELGRYLESDPTDSVPGLWRRRACDAFEALFFPASLKAALNDDNGSMIGRLMRTQNALYAWDAELTRSEQALKN